MILELGQVVITRGVATSIEQNPAFAGFVVSAIRRHQKCDWSELDSEDQQENELSVEQGYRVISAFTIPNNDDKKLWVITEANRTLTTVLYPEEY